MDVRLCEEQRALRQAAAQLVDRLGPGSVADLDHHERRAKLEAALGATEWRELRAADDRNEPSAGTIEVALITEELGRGLADVPFLGPTLSAELRRIAGTAAAVDAETVLLASDLSALARGSGATLAVDSAGARTGLSLAGADHELVSTVIDESPIYPVDLTRVLAPVLPASATRIGALPADGMDRWTAFGLAVACADLVGVMRGALELARSYACTRQQFGAAIGSFQAVQHLLADAHVAVEGSRSTALHAAWAVDRLDPDQALAAAAGAKAYCTRAALAVCETSIQVHGGIGNTWECLAHVYLRRALVSADLLGNVGPNLQRVLDHRLRAAS